MSEFYVTTYCNHPHRRSNGYPLNHECHVLPPAALDAEVRGDFGRSIEIISEAKPLKVSRGVRCKHVWGRNYRWTRHGVREVIPVCCEKCGVARDSRGKGQ